MSVHRTLQEQTRSASTRRRSTPDRPTGSIIMNTAVDTPVVVLQSHLKRPSNERGALSGPLLAQLVLRALKPIAVRIRIGPPGPLVLQLF
jgi:hypothetical protein